VRSNIRGFVGAPQGAQYPRAGVPGAAARAPTSPRNREETPRLLTFFSNPILISSREAGSAHHRFLSRSSSFLSDLQLFVVGVVDSMARRILQQSFCSGCGASAAPFISLRLGPCSH